MYKIKDIYNKEGIVKKKFTKKELEDGLNIGIDKGGDEEFQTYIIKIQYKKDGNYEEVKKIVLNKPLRSNRVEFTISNISYGEYIVSLFNKEGILINMISFEIKQSKKIYILLGVLCAISLGVFTYFYNLEIKTPELVNKILDSQGDKNLGELSEDPNEKQKQLDDAIEMGRVSMLPEITVKNNKGDFKLQNKMDNCMVQVVFYQYDNKTGEIIDKENPIYISPTLNSSTELIEENTITPYYNGDYVKEGELIVDLDRGIYDCISVWNKYDLEQNYLGSLNFTFTLNVE